MELTNIKIAAPVCSVQEAQAVIDAGADEIYFGVLPDEWVEKYSEADLLTRRQGRGAHLNSLGEMAKIVTLANAGQCTAVLTVNSRFSLEQEKMVLDLVSQWEKCGGHTIMVSDLGILLALQQRHSPLQKYLSLLTGVFNAMSVQSFAGLGISRVVLPRDLTITEMSSIINSGPAGMEYEVLVLNQKCQFIDGMCHFYHNLRYHPDLPCSFKYEKGRDGLPEAWSIDPDYEGHGCHIPWRSAAGPVRHLRQDDWNTPYCAACLLPLLASAGIGCIKIAGRGFPLEIVVRGVTFLRRVIDLWRECEMEEQSEETKGKIRELYSQTFKNPCGNRCYIKSFCGPHCVECLLESVESRDGLIKSFCGPHGVGGLLESVESRGGLIKSFCGPHGVGGLLGSVERRGGLIKSFCGGARGGGFLEKSPPPQEIERANWIDWRKGEQPGLFSNSDRIYFGHETCFHLLPSLSDVLSLIRQAKDKDVKVSLVTPFLTEQQFPLVCSLIEGLAKELGESELEVVCGDWGLLYYLCRQKIGIPVVGRLLSAQPTDPRIKRVLDSQRSIALPRRVRLPDGSIGLLKKKPPSSYLSRHYRSCWLDKPRIIDFLKSRGVQRCEISNPAQGIELATGSERCAGSGGSGGRIGSGWSYSLWFPYVLVSVMRHCPGPGEDFNVSPGREKCTPEEVIPWQSSSFPVEIIRYGNGLYYYQPQLPFNLETLPVDRIVCAPLNFPLS